MAIDPEALGDVAAAPCAVFDQLATRADQPRFFVRDADAAWQPVTFRAYADEIRDAALFCARRIGTGDRAAVFGTNSVSFSAAALGIQAAGGVMVPIYPASTPEQAAYVVRHAGARMIVVGDAELLGRLATVWTELPDIEAIVVIDPTDVDRVLAEHGEAGQAVADRLVHWSALRREGSAAATDDPGAIRRHLDALSPDMPGLMLYTSGSTGRPKGVPLTHGNLSGNWADWVRCNAPRLDYGAVDLLWLPMSHIFGFGELCTGNLLGWTSYLSTPKRVLDDMPEVAPHVFMSVPAYWDKLAKLAGSEPTPQARREALHAATGGRLRFCLSGGAGLDRSVKDLFAASDILVQEGYGLTECSPTLTLNRPDDYRFDSVGKPLPSVDLRLAPDGEIQARGPNVFAGYHDDPEATAAAFTDDGWFRTGDLGRFTDDGFLQIIGRIKEILVTAGGKNIAPVNIETRLSRDPLLAHAVVYGDGKKYLVAGLWVDPVQAEGRSPDDVDAELDALVARVNGDLARFEQIKKWVRLDAQPLTVADGLLTSTLKLRRRAIYTTFASAFESLYA